MAPNAVRLVRVIAAGLALAALSTCAPDKRDTAAERVTIAIPDRAHVPAVAAVSYLSLTPAQALALNANLPVLTPGPSAKSFAIGHGPVFDQAAECLTAAIYYEAASEPAQGQRAVAQVVLNRVRHPAFPKTVCGVVYQGAERVTGCQFTFTCDGSLARIPARGLWLRAHRIAVAALQGEVEPSVGVATHYHANFVVPYWASSLTPSASIGAHIFYRWNGFWGTPAAFRGRYAMREPDPAGLLGRVETAAVDGTAIALPDSAELRIVDARDTHLPAATPVLRTLKADIEAGGLREDLTARRTLVADSREKVTLLADEGRTPLR